MIVAVSGARAIPDGVDAAMLIGAEFRRLEAEGVPIREVRTGAQFGVDTAAYEAAVALMPSIRRVLYVPVGARHNEDLGRRHNLAGCGPAHRCGVSGGTPAAIYAARNRAMVDDADVLLAFPLEPVEQVRGSGTWQTVRHAREKRCRVIVVPLNAPYARTDSAIHAAGHRFVGFSSSFFDEPTLVRAECACGWVGELRAEQAARNEHGAHVELERLPWSDGGLG